MGQRFADQMYLSTIIALINHSVHGASEDATMDQSATYMPAVDREEKNDSRQSV